jgi:hypothetical protein
MNLYRREEDLNGREMRRIASYNLGLKIYPQKQFMMAI